MIRFLFFIFLLAIAIVVLFYIISWFTQERFLYNWFVLKFNKKKRQDELVKKQNKLKFKK